MRVSPATGRLRRRVGVKVVVVGGLQWLWWLSSESITRVLETGNSKRAWGGSSCPTKRENGNLEGKGRMAGWGEVRMENGESVMLGGMRCLYAYDGQRNARDQ